MQVQTALQEYFQTLKGWKKIHYYNNIPYSKFNLVAWKKQWCFLPILKDLQIITDGMLRRVYDQSKGSICIFVSE